MVVKLGEGLYRDSVNRGMFYIVGEKIGEGQTSHNPLIRVSERSISSMTKFEIGYRLWLPIYESHYTLPDRVNVKKDHRGYFLLCQKAPDKLKIDGLTGEEIAVVCETRFLEAVAQREIDDFFKQELSEMADSHSNPLKKELCRIIAETDIKGE